MGVSIQRQNLARHLDHVTFRLNKHLQIRPHPLRVEEAFDLLAGGDRGGVEISEGVRELEQPARGQTGVGDSAEGNYDIWRHGHCQLRR